MAKTFNFRYEDGVEQELAELCTMYRTSKNKFLNSCVRSEYNKLKGDPKLQATLQQLGELQATLENLSKINA